MPTPASLRDSTQVELPSQLLDGRRQQLTAEFTGSIVESDAGCRSIGSPVEITAVSAYLSRQGVRLP